MLTHEQIFVIWEAVTRQTQIDFTLPNIFIEIEEKKHLGKRKFPNHCQRVWCTRESERYENGTRFGTPLLLTFHFGRDLTGFIHDLGKIMAVEIVADSACKS